MYTKKVIEAIWLIVSNMTYKTEALRFTRTRVGNMFRRVENRSSTRSTANPCAYEAISNI